MSLDTRSSWWDKIANSIASTRFGTWVNRNTLPHLDRMTMRASGGRISGTTLIAGLPVFQLTTTGAKSGQQRTSSLIGIPDGREIVVIASNWGQKRNPAWYYNLRANPQADVTVDGETRAFTAREATPEEYEKYWDQAVDLYSGYANYKEWCGDRKIPIMVLSPMESDTREG